MKTAAVIPAFNVQDTIEHVVTGTAKHANTIIVVDDASADRTVAILEQLGVCPLRHAVNKGYEAALRTGFAHALAGDSDLIVTLDSDGQHDPDDVARFLDEFERSRADLIIGSRLLSKEEWGHFPISRLYGNRAVTFITNLAIGRKVTTDSQSGFRLFTREALESLHLKGERMEISSEIIAEADRNRLAVREIPIVAKYSKEVSHVHAFRDVLHIVEMLVAKHFLKPAATTRPDTETNRTGGVKERTLR